MGGSSFGDCKYKSTHPLVFRVKNSHDCDFQVEDFSLCKSLDCFLGISADYVVLVEQSKNQDVLFCTPTHSIIGWTSHGNRLVELSLYSSCCYHCSNLGPVDLV